MSFQGLSCRVGTSRKPSSEIHYPQPDLIDHLRADKSNLAVQAFKRH